MSKSQRRHRSRSRQRRNSTNEQGGKTTQSAQAKSEQLAADASRTKLLIIGLAVVGGAFLWAYWPTLVDLVQAWEREPDYSHGFFVAPLAIYFLWYRRDLKPASSHKLAWGGMALILLSLLVRYAGAYFYIDAIDGWSIPFWILGVIWLFWGSSVAWWAAPAAAFLWFMVPLPWRVERWLSLPLQGIATKLSTWVLQCLSQPAVAAGNTILLGDQRLEVVDACSGLRIFVGIFALAFAYVICVRRPWWERGVLLLSALPIALIANSTRIVVTGLLYQHASSEAAQKFSHDVSGWVSIPFAALLFAGVLFYLGRLLREVEVVDVGDLVRRRQLQLQE
jgi:exosortase